MAAYFGAIEKAPFTAICLLTEMVGTMEQILPMLIVTFISYTVYRQRLTRWAANLRRPSRRNVWLGPNKLVISPTKQQSPPELATCWLWWGLFG
nr:chloride channel protein [Limosilactobacillus fermentum]